jgi:hypothetical protein
VTHKAAFGLAVSLHSPSILAGGYHASDTDIHFRAVDWPIGERVAGLVVLSSLHHHLRVNVYRDSRPLIKGPRPEFVKADSGELREAPGPVTFEHQVPPVDIPDS